MHVVVVGCGRVGSGLALALEEQQHTVAVIDRRPEALDRLTDSFKGDRIVGVGFDRSRLAQAGVDRAEAVAAVTNGDNSNIVVARVAREAFGVERVVARIYDPRRAAIYERLGIPTVASVQWSIDRVLRRLLPDGAHVEWIDPSARLCLVERAVPDAWAGSPIDALELDGIARITGLSRLGKGQVVVSGLVVQQGDVVWATVDGDNLDDFDRHLARGPKEGG